MSTNHTTVNRSVIIGIVVVLAGMGAYMLAPKTKLPFAPRVNAAIVRDECKAAYAAVAEKLMDAYVNDPKNFDKLESETSVTFFEDCQKEKGLPETEVQSYEDYSLQKALGEQPVQPK